MDYYTSTVVRQYFVNKTHQSPFIIRRNNRAVVSVLVPRLVITITLLLAGPGGNSMRHRARTLFISEFMQGFPPVGGA
jgi:hypothetical protein